MATPEVPQGQTCAVAFQRVCYCLRHWNGLYIYTLTGHFIRYTCPTAR